ncbi:peptidylprolyl isomerase [Pseudoflavonifractor sp. AF19-9AC]|uniref:peptidylprolyl isomerase n=1 Tax=Pseudoflavonifractor sp. AF19-9AC TaxID=2292244 RepID=UPI0026B54450
MPTNLERAAKGHKKSMMELYLDNRTSVYIFCKLMLEDEQEAGWATSAVFDEAWRELMVYTTWTEVSFHHKLMVLAAKYCWRHVFGHMQKKVKVAKPTSDKCRKVQSKNYYGPVADGMELLQCALSQMAPIQRYVYLAIISGNLSTRELGQLIGQSNEEIITIYNSSLSSLSCYLPADIGGGLSYLQIQSLLQKAGEAQDVPEEVDCACVEQIKAKSKLQMPPFHIMLFSGCLLVCGFILIAYLVFSMGSSEPNNREKQMTDSSVSDSSTEETQTSGSLRADATYYADIVIQDYGTITVELDQNAAPITVENFISLAESGFYDGLTFHRIIEGFMMQDGDPEGDGTGGSGSTIVGEFEENGYENTLSHTRGAVSMARSNDYDSASSQFFIVQEDASESLDGKYAVFGYVVDGMEIVDEICSDANPTDGNGSIAPEEQPVITTITITEEGLNR